MREIALARTGAGRLRLELGHNETDSTDKVVRGCFVGGDRNELYRKGDGVWPDDQAGVVQFDEAEKQRGATTNGIDIGLPGVVRRERVVVAIDDDHGAGKQERIEGCCLLRIDAERDEALPVGPS